MSEHRRFRGSVEITNPDDAYKDLRSCACSLCRHTRGSVLQHAEREFKRVLRDYRFAGVTKLDDVYYILQALWQELDSNG